MAYIPRRENRDILRMALLVTVSQYPPLFAVDDSYEGVVIVQRGE